jgi:hypothetical protein
MPATRRASATTATCLPRSAALRLARAALARHEAEVRLDLVGVADALDIIEGGDERGGGDRADAGDGAQTLDARIVGGELLEGLVGVRELGVEVAQDREQRRDRGTQLARQRQGGDPLHPRLGTAGGHAVALLAEESADQGDRACPRPDHGVTDGQAAAHMPLGIGEPMRRAIGTKQAGVRQRAGISPVGRHLARAGRVHGREVGIGDDALVAQPLHAARDPLAVGRGLEHDARPGPLREHGREALGLGADPLLDQLAPPPPGYEIGFPSCARRCQDGPWLASPLCGVDRGVPLWGSLCHHVKREASRFITSTLVLDGAVHPEAERALPVAA